MIINKLQLLPIRKSLLQNIWLNFSYSKSPMSVSKEYLNNLRGQSQKLLLKQTVAEKKSPPPTPNYDQQFDAFLSQYKEKHKEYASIIDLSQYTQGVLKSRKQQEDELEWLNEFRKRQQNQLYQKAVKEMKPEPTQDEEKTESEYENDDDGPQVQDQLDESSSEEDESFGMSQKKTFGEQLFETGDFCMLIIDQGVTTQVTTLQRIQHFRYLVFMGNCNGIVGYGKGQGNDFEDALDKATTDCKKNLIAINLDHFLSFPRKIKAKFQGFEMTVEPNKTMNSWGHPVIASMLILAGISHCRFKLVHRNLNNYAMVMCYMKVVTQNYTPQQISEIFGIKVYRRNWGRPVFINNPSNEPF